MARQMKSSGIDWIGDIPKDWTLRKIKFFANVYNGDSISDEEKELFSNPDNAIPYISTKDINVNTQKINYENGMYIPIDNTDFKRAPQNTSLLCIEGGSAGRKIGFTNQEVCFVNKLCCFNTADRFDPKSLYYILQSDAFLTDFFLNINGLIGGVSVNTIKNILIPMPPSEEQIKISRYLDIMVGQIDKMIGDEWQKVDLLKKLRQSVISQAVTQGLTPHKTQMRTTGIEYLGNIPKHWDLKKLKYVAKIDPAYQSRDLPSDAEVSFAPMECIGSNSFEPITAILGNVVKGYTYFANGDIVMAKVTPCFENGNIAIVDRLINDIGFGSSELYVFRVTDINRKFLLYVLQSYHFKQVGESTMYGTGGLKRVSSDFVKNYKVPLPDTDEQQKIVDYLDAKTVEIDSAITAREAVIAKLTEYKKSLIHEVVTGKKEVA